MFAKKSVRILVALIACLVLAAAVLPGLAEGKLDAPKLKKASANEEGIRISWESVSGAAGYRVYRKTAGTDWEKIAAVNEETHHYQDNSVKSGKTYSYTVKAVDAEGKTGTYDHSGLSAKWVKAEKEENKTETSSGKAEEKALSKPKVKTPSVKADGVQVKWESVSGAAKYKIFRRETTTAKWKQIKTVNGSKTSYRDTTVKSGRTYYYTVKAVDSAGKLSKYDKTGKSITYFSVPELKKTESVEKGIKITWKAVSGAPLYRVSRKTPGGSWRFIGTTKSTSYTDTKIAKGTTYLYTVRVVSKDNKKKLSECDKAGISGMFVGHVSVSELTVHDGYTSATSGTHHDGYVEVKWNSVPGAAKYRVFHKTGAGKWIGLKTVSGTSYKDYDVVSGNKYLYKVRAMDASGKYIGTYDKSGKSITYYAAPTLTDCTRSGEALLTTWEPVEGITNYRVSRKIDGGTWKTIAFVNTTSYLDTTMPSGTRCWYTVWCCDANMNELSAKDPVGVNNTSYMDRPILIGASAANGGVSFTWQAVDKAVNYHIYRKNGDRTAWVDLGYTGGTSTTYFDSTAQSGTVYYYTVATCDAGGTEDLSLYNESGVVVTYYKVPVLKKIENTTGGVKLTWSRVDGIGQYRIYRKTGNEAWTAIGTAKDITYTDANVVSTGNYVYTVSCLLNDTEVSGYNTTGLKTQFYWNPQGVTSPRVAADFISFSWEAVDGISTYEVQRQLDGETTWTTVGTVSERTFKDTAPKSGYKATYRVRCWKGGKAVSAASVTKKVYFLAAPTGVSLTPGDKQIKVTWSSPTGARGYEIWRSEGAAGSFKKIKTISSGATVSYTDKGLSPKTNYTYYIIATSSDGKSVASTKVNAMTD